MSAEDLFEEWKARGHHVPTPHGEMFVVDVPASNDQGRDPLLVLHGFPSCSFDWRSVLGALSGAAACRAPRLLRVRALGQTRRSVFDAHAGRRRRSRRGHARPRLGCVVDARHGRQRGRRGARPQPRRHVAVRDHATGAHQRQHLHRHGAPDDRPAIVARSRRRTHRAGRRRRVQARPRGHVLGAQQRSRGRTRHAVAVHGARQRQHADAAHDSLHRRPPQRGTALHGRHRNAPVAGRCRVGPRRSRRRRGDDRYLQVRASRRPYDDPRQGRSLPDDRVPRPLRRRRPASTSETIGRHAPSEVATRPMVGLRAGRARPLAQTVSRSGRRGGRWLRCIPRRAAA